MIRRKYNSRKLSHPFVLWKCQINGFFLLHKTIMMDFTKWWSCTKQSMAWLYRVLQISDWGNKPQQSWVCFSSVRFGNRYSLKYLFYQYMNGKNSLLDTAFLPTITVKLQDWISNQQNLQHAKGSGIVNKLTIRSNYRNSKILFFSYNLLITREISQT